MLHTIQADFYRLFRSKGFWITEAILVLNILSGVIFGATGHVGVNTESKLPQATEVWTGFKALTNYSSSISVTILFTIIVITLVLGTDLTQTYTRIAWPMAFLALATTLPKAQSS